LTLTENYLEIAANERTSSRHNSKRSGDGYYDNITYNDDVTQQ